MSNIATIVDELGMARAVAAEANARVKELESQLKAEGPGAYEGDLFLVKVSQSHRQSVDWKAIAAKLEPSYQLVTAHTKVSEVVRLTIAAKKKEAA